MSKASERLIATVMVLSTVVLVLAGVELVLRFLPVATGLRTVEVTAASPVFHFAPNRSFVFSRDWDLDMVNRGHVNNAGFVNDQEYRAHGAGPLLGVVGDSYIEAAMVPYPETLHGRLAKRMQGRLRVYSFGASGAPLSQYLVWARHAVQEHGATALLISVVGNDFDESHSAYKTGPGFWHYMPDPGGELRLQLVEYHPGPMRGLVASSALARYLSFNLQVGARLDELKSVFSGASPAGAGRYAGNTRAEVDAARARDSLAVIDAFFRDLPGYTGLPAARVVFTVDGFRYPDVAAASSDTYFGLMRRAFLEKARALGYDAVDLDPSFFDRHARKGERFEYPRDGHWNRVGHEVAFEAVMKAALLAQLLREPQ